MQFRQVPVMTETKHYIVQFEDVPETEQLIFKLIFSISAKTKNRPHHYQIKNENDDSATEDVLISTHRKDGCASDKKIFLVDQGSECTDCSFVIQRPLIATRTLLVLDRYIQNCLEVQQTSLDMTATVKEVIENENDEQGGIDFCITEEEASELAIVADETLSNPANEKVEIPEPRVINQESTLVAFERSANKPKQTSKDAGVTTNALDKPRAIVVDDSASVRKQIELELDLFDVEVDYAESVEQTFELLNNNKYDLAFLDVVLPDGDGFQICKTIKQTTGTTKVVMLTGKATAADKIKGTMVGCDAYLVKPVGRMTFQNTVCNYIKLKAQNEAMHG